MWLGAHAETGDNTNSTAQIYSPAYMFNGPRPAVLSSPESADYGETFFVDTAQAADIESVVFIRPSATTHSINMEQRYVPLGFSQVDADTLALTAPTARNTAPPGYYMLFIVDSQGRPSEAPFVRLGGDLPPVVEAGPDQEIILPAAAQLDGTVVDFNQNPEVSTQWSPRVGPCAGDVRRCEPGRYDGDLLDRWLVCIEADCCGRAFHRQRHAEHHRPSGRPRGGPRQSSSDDAEEKDNGSVTVTSLDLEMTEYDVSGPHRMVGLRFANVDIVRGTQISDAYIQFTAQEANSTETTLTIAGQAADNAPSFAASLDNLTSRPTTNAQAIWNVAPWSLGQSGINERTSDIGPIIQEIVNRPGWSAGGSIVILISGVGNRVARSFDQNAVDAAVLNVNPAGDQACSDGVDNDGDGAVDYPR